MEENSRFAPKNDPVPELLQNSGLACRDCVHLMAGKVLECEKYYKKPGYVLYNTKKCPKFEEKNDDAEAYDWMRDRYRGCLVGGAAGDALGYAVEFLSEEAILRKYGKEGIRAYELTDGKALISDDTQMTLFTANGLLIGTTRGRMRGIMGDYPSYIALCYKDWLKTQLPKDISFSAPRVSWVGNLPEMQAARAPGQTCINSLYQDETGSVADPKNRSKGCGGVMRVAPVGLYFGGKENTQDEIDMIGAETAALTHGHELGYMPAAMLVHILHLLAHDADMTVSRAVSDAKEAMGRLFGGAKHTEALLALVDKALLLAEDGTLSDMRAIAMLGQGWVAEETLAIAVYCAVKYENDFEKAIVAAVNHGGDSDSTGAVTGNIVGARLGLRAIPQKFSAHLELKDRIVELADDLYDDCQISEYGETRDPVWEAKYLTYTYPKNDTEHP